MITAWVYWSLVGFVVCLFVWVWFWILVFVFVWFDYFGFLLILVVRVYCLKLRAWWLGLLVLCCVGVGGLG